MICGNRNFTGQEGFERTHLAEKLQAYNIARASCGEVRSLLYVIEDNYPGKVTTVRETRALVGQAGCLVTGLIASTRRRLAGKVAGFVIGIGFIAWVSLQVLT